MNDEQATQPEPDAPESAADTAPTINLETLEADLAEAREQYLRVLAELDNTRKRAQRDIENAHRYALDRFVGDLAAVRESLEMGLRVADTETPAEALAQGMAMTLKQLDQVLEKYGVAVLDPAGQRFNPELHEAMQVLATADAAPDTVVQVLQKGLTLNGRLLKPALVIVARAPEADTGGGA